MRSPGRTLTLIGSGMLTTAILMAPATTVGQGDDGWALAVAEAAVSVPAPIGDGCPIESPTGLDLYIASTRGGGPQDIYVSHRESIDAPWSGPVNVGAPVNSQAHDFCPTPLSDGRLLFVSGRDRPAACGPALEAQGPVGDIFLSTYDAAAEVWGEPVHLGCVEAGTGPSFASGEFGPSLLETADATWLYFSSGGTGGSQDIYVSELGADGSFGAPAVVAELSTEAEDMMPNVSPDGLEVVFNSNREGSEGQDVWTSTRSAIDQPWSEPVRLGPNVNTAGNEQRASLSADGLRLHFGRDGDIFVSTRER